MLPKLVRLRAGLSWRGATVSMICAVGLLALPTFHGVAQSPDPKQPSVNKQPVIQSSGDAQAKPGGSAAVNGTSPAELKSDPPVVPRAAQNKPPSIEYLPKPTAGEQQIVKTLEDKTTFDFEDLPLPEVMKQLSDKHNINIVIAMDTRIAKDTRVTLKVRDVSLRNALKVMLEFHPTGLSHIVADEVLKIMPREELEAQGATRIYPVQDLVGQSEDFESLIQAIQQSVARGTWSAGQPGGPFGAAFGGGFGAGLGSGGRPSTSTGGISKVPASGSLVIHHNLQVHDEVLQLLRGLREAKSIPATE